MAREAITRSTRHSQRLADLHRIPAPLYQPGQKVWLSSRDISLQVEFRKLAPHFVGPCEVEKIINSSAVRLKLPASLPVHPTFHVSQLKLVSTSDLQWDAGGCNMSLMRKILNDITCSAFGGSQRLCLGQGSQRPG